MIIRKTTSADIEAAAQIYDMARSFMRGAGNAEQWSSGHPNADEVIADIADGTGHVCEENGEIIAVFFFKKGEDPTYKKIYNGEWLSSDEYAVIHRIAVKYNGLGLANKIYDYCYSNHPHIRIDTHRDNIPMQRSLEKNGFKYCGIIYLANGDERLAYEKL